LRKEKGDHKSDQNKAKEQFRQLENTNTMLQNRIKDLGKEGSSSINGRDELIAKIKRLNDLLKNQESKHETALKRINELETQIAANAARGREDTRRENTTAARFRRPTDDFPHQEEPPKVRRGIKPRFEKSTSFPVPKSGRFARPGRALPRSEEQSVNPEVQTKKMKQHGRGCLLLWPTSMLNEAEEFYQISRMKSKGNEMPVALLAIPVLLTLAKHDCPATKP